MPRGLTMPSDTVAADLALLGTDTAAIRKATYTERQRLGARWRAVVYALVLRTCAGVDVVVAEAGLARRGFSNRQLHEVVTAFSRQHGLSRSGGVVLLSLRLFPGLQDMLVRHRPSAGPCASCECVWRAAGPLDTDASESRMVRLLLTEATERTAA